MERDWKLAAVGGLGGAVLALAVGWTAASMGWVPSAGPAGPAIHAYLLAHPEVLLEAQEKLQAQQDASQDATRQAAVDKLGMKAFLDPRLAFVTGPANATTTIVEFFDYNCPYCRASLPAVKKFYAQHKDTRFAFIEFPIKGAQSTLAARAGLAARNQPDKYVAFHFALMSEENLVDSNILFADAQKAGLDITKLKADMAKSDVDLALAAAHTLAQAVNIDGTPAFIINGKIREGAMDDDILKLMTKT
jgi:protein-disulfide isomerase